MRRFLFLPLLLMMMFTLAACEMIKADVTDQILPDLEIQITQPAPTDMPELLVPTDLPVIDEQPVDECLACHSNKELLVQVAEPEEVAGSKSSGVGSDVPPLEPWEKVFIDVEKFSPTVHGQLPCTDCHAGVQSPDKSTAHTGLVARPSAGEATICAGCHPDVTEVFANSLHVNQTGFWYALDMRSFPEAHDALEEMFTDHCASCHTSCGDCHINQPDLVGGGLVDGHVFVARPHMTQSCTVCHSSRVGNEYLGKNEGLPGDVHYREGQMSCVDCHTSHEMHGIQSNCNQCHPGPETGQMPPVDHRYAGVETPSCESCHIVVATGSDGVEMHQQHGADLSCQVCHSISYSSCDSCHVQINDKTGETSYTIDASYLTFLIGRNTYKSFDRPYDYVPVRHIPVSPASFEYYGDDLLANFNLLPTWAYATPHNIQIITPQNRNCNACHGNADIFLTADKVSPEELEANLGVIVSEVPLPIGAIVPTAETP